MLRPAALAVLLLATAGCRSLPDLDDLRLRPDPRPYNHYSAAPPADPSRKVSGHDCTRPVPGDGGNLRCI
jgi:hypothetical protein